MSILSLFKREKWSDEKEAQDCIKEGTFLKNRAIIDSGGGSHGFENPDTGEEIIISLMEEQGYKFDSIKRVTFGVIGTWTTNHLYFIKLTQKRRKTK